MGRFNWIFIIVIALSCLFAASRTVLSSRSNSHTSTYRNEAVEASVAATPAQSISGVENTKRPASVDSKPEASAPAAAPTEPATPAEVSVSTSTPNLIVAAAPAPAPPAPTPIATPASTPLALSNEPELKIETPHEAEEGRPSGARVYVGTGISYSAYTENLSDVDANYHKLGSGNINIGADFGLSENWSVEAFYKNTPLQFDNASASLPVSKGDWKTLGLQAKIHSESLSTPWSLRRTQESPECKGDFRYVVGIQLHQMPLALFKNGTNEPAVRDMQILNAAVGAAYMRYLDPTTRALLEGRFQYPLSKSATQSEVQLSLNPVAIFDGSIGIEKKFAPKTWIGVHWSGQYHKIKFGYSDPLIDAEGSQSALNSVIELRLSLDF